MGQHTWFVKDKNKLFHISALNGKLIANANGDGLNGCYLDDIDIRQISFEIETLSNENKTEFHDVFRTTKKNNDGTYLDDIITSRKECLEWIENNIDSIYFNGYNNYNVAEKHKMFKQIAEKINQFWDKYNDGAIHFG